MLAASYVLGSLALRPDLVTMIIVLGALVLVPIGLEVAFTPDREGLYPKPLRAAAVLHFPAAVALLLSFSFPAWSFAGWIAAPWCIVTILVGLSGLRRLVERGLSFVEETAVDLGCVFLAVSGVWSIIAAAHLSPLNFGRTTIALAVVHFMYAGFVLPAIGAMVRRTRASRVSSAALYGVLVSVPLVALGISFSALMERVGASLLVVSAGVIAGLQLTRRGPSNKLLQRLALALSSMSLFLGMLLAAWYAVVATEDGGLSQRTMLWLHGIPNGFGFGLLGLLAWRLDVPAPLAPAVGIPFSPARSRWRVGPAYFQRAGLEDASRRLEGLTDSLDVFARPDFPTRRVHPDIRDFYERTERYELLVVPKWTRAFRLLYRGFRFFARSIGQTDFPLLGGRPVAIANRIVALTGERPGLRAWIRTYAPEGKRAMYVAEYATHRLRDVTYMDIAFPYPGGNLASILRPDPIDVGDRLLGFRLTTWDPVGWGDAGIWFANRLVPIKLPFRETIDVWAPGMSGVPAPLNDPPSDTRVVARHQLWMFGLRYLVLDYYIAPQRGK